MNRVSDNQITNFPVGKEEIPNWGSTCPYLMVTLAPLTSQHSHQSWPAVWPFISRLLHNQPSSSQKSPVLLQLRESMTHLHPMHWIKGWISSLLYMNVLIIINFAWLFINSVYSVSLQLQFLFVEWVVGWRLTDNSLSGLWLTHTHANFVNKVRCLCHSELGTANPTGPAKTLKSCNKYQM